MRILVVSGLYPSEANPVFGVFVARQVEALRALGNDVVVVANCDWRPGAINALRKYHLLYTRAKRAARHGQFDVVVGHFLYPTAMIAAKAAQIAGVPYVLVAHGSDVTSLASRSDFMAKRSREALAKADGVAAVSGALLERMRTELTLPLDVEEHVGHMGVDTDTYAPVSDARAKLGFSPGQKVALFVGNLVYVKGPDRALRACLPLLKEGTLDTLVFVGSGSLADGLKDTASASGVGDQVVFTGQIDPTEVAAYMTAADLLILTSRQEGAGLVVLEALSCGTPVAVTDVGGLKEIAPGNGLSVDLNEKEEDSWTSTLRETLARDPDDSVAASCIEYARAQDVTSQTAAFAAFLQHVVADHAV